MYVYTDNFMHREKHPGLHIDVYQELTENFALLQQGHATPTALQAMA